jgi:hypothetical protein
MSRVSPEVFVESTFCCAISRENFELAVRGGGVVIALIAISKQQMQVLVLGSALSKWR